MFAYIPATVVVSVVELPSSGVVIRTGRLIPDLNGSNSEWARPCGYYDVDDPALVDTLVAAGLTPDQAADALEAIDAWAAARTARRDALEDVTTGINNYIPSIDVMLGQDPRQVDPEDALDELHLKVVHLLNNVKTLDQVLIGLIPSIGSLLEITGIVSAVNVSAHVYDPEDVTTAVLTLA